MTDSKEKTMTENTFDGDLTTKAGAKNQEGL